uniref:Putative secreted protein n=1 Tax=Ixodes ricinus TaxID=34613 RepID=A0A6B0TXS7_IXORI
MESSTGVISSTSSFSAELLSAASVLLGPAFAALLPTTSFKGLKSSPSEVELWQRRLGVAFWRLPRSADELPNNLLEFPSSGLA